MKSLFTIIMLLPFFLNAQNVGIGTVDPGEKLEVNGIIFTSQGGVKFPDGTIQTTAYMPNSSMMDMNLSGIVMEFEPGANVIGPAQGDGISDGINVLSAAEGMSRPVIFGGGGGNGGPAIAGDFSFSRISDVNTSQIRSLMINADLIPYIEVFYLRMNSTNGNYVIDQIIRMEECYISSLSSSSGGDAPFESVSIAFGRACYRSYERDENGAVTRTVDTCYQNPSLPGGCNCGSF